MYKHFQATCLWAVIHFISLNVTSPPLFPFRFLIHWSIPKYFDRKVNVKQQSSWAKEEKKKIVLP